MKKAVLIYNALVFVFCFIISLVDIFTSSFKIETILLITFSILFLLPIFFIFEKRHLKKSLNSLAIINLIQAFSIIFFGITYKLVIGPDLTLYFISSGDKIMQFSFKFFNIFSYFNYIKNDNTLALGINFTHLFMFIYFYLEAKQIKE
ncbi:hypothetical protein [Flavobacterium filum]|uniref:hypothetical protein n=1 Tax=Flavobacterium filum TaxID=370974 RepID=UPI00047B2ECF|nr:hypothetical protein [Flavobacterium filum]